MEFCSTRTLLFLLLGVITSESSAFLTTQFMPIPCKNGDTKYLQPLSVYSTYFTSEILKLSSYQPYARCSAIIMPWNSMQAITISVKKMNLFYYDNKIVINDGYTSTIVTGTNSGGRVLYTSRHPGAHVNITFTSGNHIGFDGFELVYTAFINGTNCDSLSLYQCGNGRCISTDAACDGLNHCGMVNPEECNLSAGVIVGYSFGSIFFVIACVCVIVVLCRRRRRMRCVQSTTVVHPPPPRYIQPPPMINTVQYPVGNIQGSAAHQYPQGPPRFNAPDQGRVNPLYH